MRVRESVLWMFTIEKGFLVVCPNRERFLFLVTFKSGENFTFFDAYMLKRKVKSRADVIANVKGKKSFSNDRYSIARARAEYPSFERQRTIRLYATYDYLQNMIDTLRYLTDR